MPVLQKIMKRILNNEYSEIKRKNKSYSLRAYAKRLALAGPELSTFLNDKRKFSNAKALEILERTKISHEKKEKLIKFIKGNESLYDVSSCEELFTKIDTPTFDLIKDWYNYAILCLLEISPKGQSIEEIGRKLKVEKEKIADALDKLCQMDLAYQEGKSFFFSGHHITASSPVKSQSLREHHRQYIEKALESIDGCKTSERSISGITFSVSKEKVNEASKMIDNFRQYFACYFSDDESNSVYRLNLQLFPIAYNDEKH